MDKERVDGGGGCWLWKYVIAKVPTFFRPGVPHFHEHRVHLLGKAWPDCFSTFHVRRPQGFTYPPSILVKTLVDLLGPSTPANTLNMAVYSFYIFDRHSASLSPSPLQCQSLTTLKPSASIPGDGLRGLYPRAVKVRGRSPAPALPAMATTFPQPARLCRKKTMPS